MTKPETPRRRSPPNPEVRFRMVPSTPKQADAIAELIVELLDMARATRKP